MNPAEAKASEQDYTALLAAAEEALTTGSTLSLPPPGDFTPEVRHDLEQDLACIDLLRRALPILPPAAATPADGPSLTSLGRFRILRELGRGTFGIVYLEHQARI